MEAVQSVKKITQAMKMVSTAKWEKAKNLHKEIKNYRKILEDTALTVGQKDIFISNYLSKTVCIVFAGERGLCGKFNENILTYAKKLVKKFPKEKIYFWIHGKKGKKIFQKDCSFHWYKPSFSDEKDKEKIGSFILNAFQTGSCKKFYLLYPVAKTKNEIQLELLPMDYDKSLLPKKKKTVLVEPCQLPVQEWLLKKRIWTMICFASLSREWAEERTRMICMNKAVDNADNLYKKLQCFYNKKRQEKITRELSEIISARNTMY